MGARRRGYGRGRPGVQSGIRAIRRRIQAADPPRRAGRSRRARAARRVGSDAADDDFAVGVASARPRAMAMKYYDEVKRRRELAKLHVAKKQLGIDDEAWRMICLRVTDGKCDSSAAMTAAMRRALLEELRAKGFVAQPGTGTATRKFR